MSSLTRGPLPAGVYWRRRLALLLTLAVLVVAVVSMFRGGGGDDGADVTASPAAGTPTPTPAPTSAPSPSATASAPASPAPTQPPVATPTREPLAPPVGRCDNADVLVTPVTTEAVAGRTVTLPLTVRTETTEACTWRMSAQHLAVTITDGTEGTDGVEVWSTRQCPGLVPDQDVVVRRDVDSTVALDWDARYSERGCPAQSEWVEPGELQVAAATYGGQPATADLVLTAPTGEPAAPAGPGTTASEAAEPVTP